MIDSLSFYGAALQWQNMNLRYNDCYQETVKNFYLQIVTTVFYELTARKNSPLLSEMCAANKINFDAKNFQLEKINVSRLAVETSFDMYCILRGVNISFSENLDACSNFYESVKTYIFEGNALNPEVFPQLINLLKSIDNQLKNFSSSEENLLQDLNSIAKNRIGDDEKIISEIIKVQASMQNSLKQISEIRDGLDFRTLQEPIYQLLNLYNKIDDNLKLHPQNDMNKGYERLLKRCQSYLKYIAQSLEMLGVELINATGETFNPDKHKILDDEKFSADSVVTKVNKIGFIYKGKILEKAVVEVARK